MSGFSLVEYPHIVLTDYDKVSNQFTVGKVDVELTEDNWKP